MKSIRYHLICELNLRWNVQSGERRFQFSKVKSTRLLHHIADNCHTVEQVHRTLSDHMQYDAMLTLVVNSIESNEVFAYN